MSARPIHNATTAMRLAACAAVGLHYWSGHPLAGHVWAVDEWQGVHVVRIYARDGLARRVGRYAAGHAWQTVDSEAIPFTVPDVPSLLMAAAA